MTARAKRLYLRSLGMVSALGMDCAQSAKTLFGDSTPNMIALGGYVPGRDVVLGKVPTEPDALPARYAAHDTRNNRLLWAAVDQIRPDIDAAIAQYRASRIGIVLGTSTSGIDEGTDAYRHFLDHEILPNGFRYQGQEIGAPAEFLKDALSITGPAFVISTACSSSAKTFASASRLIRAGLCDEVLVGGVDSLCALTVSGFDALQSVDDEQCKPLSRNRAGINIGEGAALFMLGTTPSEVELMGVGESSDAHHPNAPHPDGTGALAAMRDALDRAGLVPDDIAYLNMHGTATPLNDAMEARAIHALFDPYLPISSTKPMTGHTLAAAGAIEAAMLWLSLQSLPDGAPLPRHVWDGARDDDLPALRLVDTANNILSPRSKAAMMSNSFAFGGSNVSVILGRGWPDRDVTGGEKA